MNYFLPQQEGTDLSSYFKNPEQFLPLLHQMDCMMFLIDYNIHQYVYISPNAINVLGYSAERMLQEGPVQFMEKFHPAEKTIFREKLYPDLLNMLRSLKGKPLSSIKFALNFRLRQADGQYQMMTQQSGILEVNEKMEPVRVMGTISKAPKQAYQGEIFLRVYELDPSLGWSIVRESLYATGEGKKTAALTETEIKILEYVFQGKTSKQVASELNLSTETVNRHRKNVLKKLKASNIVDAINIARERGILSKL